MRVSSFQIFNNSVTRMLDLQSGISKLNEQVSTGKRVLTPSDDPTVAARGLEIDERLSTLGQYQRNIDLLGGRIEQQETAIGTAENIMRRVNELMLQGKNGTMSPADRNALAAELSERLGELVGVANTRNESGEFIFGGLSSGSRPFTEGGGSVSYNGDQTVRQLKISESREMGEGLAGADVFMAVRAGDGRVVNDAAPGNTGTGRIIPLGVPDPASFQAANFEIRFTVADTFDIVNADTGVTVAAAQPYTAGEPILLNGVEVAIEGQPLVGDVFTVSPAPNRSVFETVQNVIDALRLPQGSPEAEARFLQTMDNNLQDVGQSIEKFLESRATLGARLNVMESQRGTNEDISLGLEKAKSTFEDVDLVEAISNLTRATTSLQAVQASFSRVQGLSLFNYF